MKITLRYPAIVNAKLKGGRTSRPIVTLPVAEFNLRILSAEDAPLAFVIESTDGKGHSRQKEIRAVGDRLFGFLEGVTYYRAGTGILQTVDDLIDAFSSSPLHTNSIFGFAMNKVRETALEFSEQGILPSGILTALRNNGVSDDNELATACAKFANQLVVDDDVQRKLDDWRTIAQDELDKYAVIDGRIFKFCGEPVYSLGHHSPPSLYYPEIQRGNSDGTSFSATSFEEALVEWENRGKKGNGRTEIIVVDPEFVTWKAEEQDFMRFSAGIESRLNDGIKRFSSRYGRAIPRNVYDSWLDLRDAIEACSPYGAEVPENLEVLTTTGIDNWRAFTRTLPTWMEAASMPEQEEIDAAVARFSERPIDIVSNERQRGLFA